MRTPRRSLPSLCVRARAKMVELPAVGTAVAILRGPCAGRQALVVAHVEHDRGMVVVAYIADRDRKETGTAKGDEVRVLTHAAYLRWR